MEAGGQEAVVAAAVTDTVIGGGIMEAVAAIVAVLVPVLVPALVRVRIGVMAIVHSGAAVAVAVVLERHLLRQRHLLLHQPHPSLLLHLQLQLQQKRRLLLQR